MVNGYDSKSYGFGRTGSNPVLVALLFLLFLRIIVFVLLLSQYVFFFSVHIHAISRFLSLDH